MALSYTGTRPILKGRDFDNAVHTWKGTVGTYSNWLLMSSDQLLDGAPNTNYTLGTDQKARRLEQEYAATAFYVSEMKNPGSGNRLDYARYRPLEFKGLVSSKVFASTFGRTPGDRGYTYSHYTNFYFDGLASSNIFSSFGHARRFTTTYGGAFDPYVFKGVTPSKALNDPGQAIPATATTSDYGHNKINEWRGIPSGKALDV